MTSRKEFKLPRVTMQVKLFVVIIFTSSLILLVTGKSLFFFFYSAIEWLSFG